MCSQNYFRFSSYLLRKTAIGWFIVNIQSGLFSHRCLERQAFGIPRMYTLSPSKSIKGSNFGEFLKDKNVLLSKRLYKYVPNLESLLTQQYVCVMCTLWSDNTCVFTCFHSVKNANYLELCITIAIKFSQDWSITIAMLDGLDEANYDMPSHTLVNCLNTYPNAPVVADRAWCFLKTFSWFNLSPWVSIRLPRVMGPVYICNITQIFLIAM